MTMVRPRRRWWMVAAAAIAGTMGLTGREHLAIRQMQTVGRLAADLQACLRERRATPEECHRQLAPAIDAAHDWLARYGGIPEIADDVRRATVTQLGAAVAQAAVRESPTQDHQRQLVVAFERQYGLSTALVVGSVIGDVTEMQRLAIAGALPSSKAANRARHLGELPAWRAIELAVREELPDLSNWSHAAGACLLGDTRAMRAIVNGRPHNATLELMATACGLSETKNQLPTRDFYEEASLRMRLVLLSLYSPARGPKSQSAIHRLEAWQQALLSDHPPPKSSKYPWVALGLGVAQDISREDALEAAIDPLGPSCSGDKARPSAAARWEPPILPFTTEELLVSPGHDGDEEHAPWDPPLRVDPAALEAAAHVVAERASSEQPCSDTLHVDRLRMEAAAEYWRRDRGDDARRILTEMASPAIEPKSTDLEYLAALLWIGLGQPRQALNSATRLLSTPTLPVGMRVLAHTARATAYAHLRQWDHSRDEARIAYEELRTCTRERFPSAVFRAVLWRLAAASIELRISPTPDLLAHDALHREGQPIIDVWLAAVGGVDAQRSLRSRWRWYGVCDSVANLALARLAPSVDAEVWLDTVDAARLPCDIRDHAACSARRSAYCRMAAAAMRGDDEAAKRWSERLSQRARWVVDARSAVLDWFADR